MAGYNHYNGQQQWPPNYQATSVSSFVEDLHHYTTSQHQPSAVVPQRNFEVVIPQQPQPYQFQQTIPQPGYQYNSNLDAHVPPQPQPHYQHIYHPPHQTTQYEAQARQPYQPVQTLQQYRQGQALPQQHLPPQPLTQQTNGHPIAQPMPVASSAVVSRQLSQPSRRSSSGLIENGVSSPGEKTDYGTMLLTLADEYFEAANRFNDKHEEHYRLTATAMACLDSALRNCKLPALQQAQISLRYAQELADKTENFDEADTILTKAIDVCERNKYTDLKYSLQLLSVRVLSQVKPKAAIRSLQGILEEAETYKHTAWEYALRYELVHLHLIDERTSGMTIVLHQLEKLATSARSHGDHAIQVFACLMEALVHLQTTSQDAIAAAHRALATVRSQLQNNALSGIPQLQVMTGFVDVCCSIRECNSKDASHKMEHLLHLQTSYTSERNGNSSWQESGSVIHLPLRSSSLAGLHLQKGGLVREDDGKYTLPFSWTDFSDADALRNFLEAIIPADKLAGRMENENRINYVVGCVRDARTSKEGETASGDTRHSRHQFECRCLIELAFLKCSRGAWNEAQADLMAADKSARTVGEGWSKRIPGSIASTIAYLRGCIQQGTGELDAALRTYQSSSLNLCLFQKSDSEQKQSQQTHRSNDLESEIHRNVCILAGLNSLLILNDPTHPQHNTRAAIRSQLSSLILSSQDKNVRNAHALVNTLMNQPAQGVSKQQERYKRKDIQTVTMSQPIQEMSKQALVKTLHESKAISNAQIKALTLATMQLWYFYGSKEHHAAQCVKALDQGSQALGNPLWWVVAKGALTDHYEFMLDEEKAREQREKGAELVKKLPEKIRESLVESVD